MSPAFAIEHGATSILGMVILGRVDGFNQHQSARKTDDG